MDEGRPKIRTALIYFAEIQRGEASAGTEFGPGWPRAAKAFII